MQTSCRALKKIYQDDELEHAREIHKPPHNTSASKRTGEEASTAGASPPSAGMPHSAGRPAPSIHSYNPHYSTKTPQSILIRPLTPSRSIRYLCTCISHTLLATKTTHTKLKAQPSRSAPATHIRANLPATPYLGMSSSPYHKNPTKYPTPGSSRYIHIRIVHLHNPHKVLQKDSSYATHKLLCQNSPRKHSS